MPNVPEEDKYENTYELRQAIKAAAEHEEGLWQSKQTYYEHVGEALLNAGCHPSRISAVGLRLLNAKLSSMRTGTDKEPSRVNPTHWYRTMSARGWTDKTYNHRGSKEEGESEGIPAGEGGDKPADVTIMGAKYNSDLVDLLGRHAKSAMLLKSVYATLDCPITDNPKEYKRLLQDMQHVVDEVDAAVSGRPKIAPNTHHLWKAKMASEFSLRRAAAAYLRARADIIDKENETYIDAKQAKKYTAGREPNMMEAYKPHGQSDALYRGWYGVPCTACGRWRVERTHHHIRDAKCTDCGHEFASGILTTHGCGAIITKEPKGGACPGCGDEIVLPQEVT